MRETFGDLWTVADLVDAVCITTNGMVKKNGRAAMGGGCALEAKTRIPWIDLELGYALRYGGNHVHKLHGVFWGTTQVVSFPTKQDFRNPSPPGLIVRSARELVELTDKEKWAQVLIPRPGAGLGGLKWDEVRKLLTPILDDRFIIIGYADERDS